jgi:hypothetical protein
MTTAIPANAITGDYVKDNEHPFVGLIVFYRPDRSLIHISEPTRLALIAYAVFW